MRGDLSASPRPSLADRNITLGSLFRCFLLIGITGFGGVLPVVVHEIVRKRRWLDTEEFTEMLSVCQVLPGPNIVNISVLFGMRVAGLPGGIVSLTGLLMVPVALVLALGTLYTNYAEVPQVQGAVRAVAAAAAGLVVAVTVRIAWPQRQNPIAVAIGVLVVMAAAWARVPLVWVIVIFAPLSLALTFMRMRRNG